MNTITITVAVVLEGGTFDDKAFVDAGVLDSASEVDTAIWSCVLALPTAVNSMPTKYT